MGIMEKKNIKNAIRLPRYETWSANVQSVFQIHYTLMYLCVVEQ